MEDNSCSLIESIMEVLGAILLIILLLIASGEIIFRYFFNYPLIWATELCRFLLIWMVFLGATVLTKRSGHLTVGASLEKYLCSKHRLILMVFVNSCIAVVLVLVAFYGTKAVLFSSKMVGPATKIPMYIVWSAVPINAAFMLYFIIAGTVKLFKTGASK